MTEDDLKELESWWSENFSSDDNANYMTSYEYRCFDDIPKLCAALREALGRIDDLEEALRHNKPAHDIYNELGKEIIKDDEVIFKLKQEVAHLKSHLKCGDVVLNKRLEIAKEALAELNHQSIAHDDNSLSSKWIENLTETALKQIEEIQS